jgi:tetratricopeptide (TPR) repeat protein
MRLSRGPHLLLLALVTLVATSDARAQTATPTQTPPQAKPAAPGEDAKAIYDHALSLYALGRYAEAAPLFERAFELKPVPALLYNAAQSHRLAGHPERAVTLYESYLRLYGDPARKAEIEAHIAELKTAIAAQQHAATSPPTSADTQGASSTTPMPPPTATSPAATPSAAPSTETLTASAPPKKKPLVKRPWFWAAVGGGALVVAGVIVGITVGTRGHQSPPASFGTIDGN